MVKEDMQYVNVTVYQMIGDQARLGERIVGYGDHHQEEAVAVRIKVTEKRASHQEDDLMTKYVLESRQKTEGQHQRK